MIHLAVMRHAPTVWNEEKRIQGHRDIPLAAAARDWLTARQVPEELCRYRVVTSPLVRTIETARLLGCTIDHVEPAIIEMDWGKWEGNRLADLRRELGADMADAEARGLDMRPDGGETPREVACRLSIWLKSLKEDTLAVTHKGVIRALLFLALEWDMQDKPPVRLDWSRIHRFQLDSGGKPKLELTNIPLEPR